MLVVDIDSGQPDEFHPSGRLNMGWEVPLTSKMGNPLPGDPVEMRTSRGAHRVDGGMLGPGRVYAVNYANNTLFVEIDTERTNS